jgi:tetratricopeptide (TPR) repeat protein
MLGVIYHAQGRFSDAEEAFEHALKINPRYTEAALNLSVTYNDRGKYDRAREVYTKAVAASVGQPNALDRFARGKLANMHADVGAAYAGSHVDEAVREYGKVPTCVPSSPTCACTNATATWAPKTPGRGARARQAPAPWTSSPRHLGVIARSAADAIAEEAAEDRSVEQERQPTSAQ